MSRRKNRPESAKPKQGARPAAERAERARKSEERFRLLVETSSDWIWEVDAEGVYTYASPRVRDLLGYEPGEVVGRTPFDFMPPGERERVVGLFLALVARRAPLVGLENTNLHKDGRRVVLETSGLPVFDAAGLFRGYRGADRDITERKRAEAALRETAAGTRAIIESIPIGMHIYRLEPGGRLVFAGANPAADRILGVDNGVFVGKTIEEAFPPLAASEVPRRYREVVGTGEPWHTEQIDYADEVIRGAFEVHAFRAGPGTVVAAFEEITERKRAELALKEGEARFRRLYNETPVMLQSVDRGGVLVDVNDYWLRRMGYERGEVIGRKVTEFYTPASRQYAEEVVQPAFFRDGVARDVPYQFVKKDGEVIDVLLSANGERDAQGRVVRSRAVIEDVTGRKRAEQALRESEERYRQLFEAESDAIFLVDNVSGAILAANAAAAGLYGYGVDELLGMKNTDLSAEPSETRRVTEETPVVMDNAVRIPLRHHRKKDGTVFPVEITGRFFTSRGREVHIAAIRDVTERLQAQESLRKSEQMLRTIVDAGPDCIKLLDRESRIILMNPAGLAMVEADSLDQVRGQAICFLMAPEYRAAFEALTEQVFAGGSGTLQFEMTGLKGRRLWLETFAVPLRDGAGEITALLGVTRDVTERKRAEEEVRRNETRMASLYRISQQTVEHEPAFLDLALHEAIALAGSAIGYLYSYDEEKREFTLNSYSKEVMKECSIGEVKTCYELDRTGIWGEAVRQRRPIVLNDFEAAHPLKKGYPPGHAKLARFLTVPVIMQGAVVAVVGVANKAEDYTDADTLQLSLLMDSVWKMVQRARAERALLESEERFRDLAESLPLTVFEADLQGRFTYANRAAFEAFGYSREEFDGGLALEQVIAPEDRERARQAVARRLQGDLSGQVEYRTLRKDGSTFPVAVASSPILRDGKPAGLRGIVMDLTERRALEEERLKAQKLASLGTLAGGIAHDFNNLLQGVFGYTSLIRLTLDRREKALEILDRTERALHQAVNLTNQLLTFSKGGRPLKKVIALQPVVENAATLALSGSRVRHELHAAEGLRPIEADEGQIGQVVRNIVLNAEQAMPLGGKVEISLSNVQYADPSGGRGADLCRGVEIRITDHGTGIPPEHLARIFDPYFTTKEKGSGLGLATSYSIVKNHDGVIAVESVLGAGTTFTVRLPASDAAPEAAGEARERAGERTGRILVMDDDAVVCDVLRKLLHMLGHEVACAGHGAEALESYRAARKAGRPFDAVILDLTIRAGLGGLETLRELRAIDPEVRAVASSGYSEEAGAAGFERQGFRAFLKKPYTVKELVEVLGRVLAP